VRHFLPRCHCGHRAGSRGLECPRRRGIRAPNVDLTVIHGLTYSCCAIQTPQHIVHLCSAEAVIAYIASSAPYPTGEGIRSDVPGDTCKFAGTKTAYFRPPQREVCRTESIFSRWQVMDFQGSQRRDVSTAETIVPCRHRGQHKDVCACARHVYVGAVNVIVPCWHIGHDKALKEPSSHVDAVKAIVPRRHAVYLKVQDGPSGHVGAVKAITACGHVVEHKAVRVPSSHVSRIYVARHRGPQAVQVQVCDGCIA